MLLKLFISLPLLFLSTFLRSSAISRDTPSFQFLEACRKGHVDVVKLTLSLGFLADANYPAVGDLNINDDLFPLGQYKSWLDIGLNLAAIHGHTNIVSLLLKAGADPTLRGSASLLHAGQNGHLETVKLLLADNRVSVFAPRFIESPAENFELEVVKYLISNSKSGKEVICEALPAVVAMNDFDISKGLLDLCGTPRKLRIVSWNNPSLEILQLYKDPLFWTPRMQAKVLKEACEKGNLAAAAAAIGSGANTTEMDYQVLFYEGAKSLTGDGFEIALSILATGIIPEHHKKLFTACLYNDVEEISNIMYSQTVLVSIVKVCLRMACALGHSKTLAFMLEKVPMNINEFVKFALESKNVHEILGVLFKSEKCDSTCRTIGLSIVESLPMNARDFEGTLNIQDLHVMLLICCSLGHQDYLLQLLEVFGETFFENPRFMIMTSSLVVAAMKKGHFHLIPILVRESDLRHLEYLLTATGADFPISEIKKLVVNSTFSFDGMWDALTRAENELIFVNHLNDETVLKTTHLKAMGIFENQIQKLKALGYHAIADKLIEAQTNLIAITHFRTMTTSDVIAASFSHFNRLK